MDTIWLAGFFAPGEPGYYVLVGVFLLALVGLFLWGNTHREKDSRAEELQHRYRVLDREQLAAIPDTELLEAVVANVMAKADPKSPDMYYLMAELSLGRRVIYSVWLMSKELEKASFEEVLQGPTAAFLELSAEGFEQIGAPSCAAAVRGVETAEDEEARAQLHADFLEAAVLEEPLAKCVSYIRDNAEDFCDVSEKTPQGDQSL